MTPFGGLSTGAIFRYYSGYPINETIGTDVNGDRDNNDRPVAGVHDLTRPILSPLDANGSAVRNGIDGNSTTLLDLQLQYVFRLPAAADGRPLRGNLQRVEQGQPGQPHRQPQQPQLHGAGRGRVDALGAARDSVYVLSSSLSSVPCATSRLEALGIGDGGRRSTIVLIRRYRSEDCQLRITVKGGAAVGWVGTATSSR